MKSTCFFAQHIHGFKTGQECDVVQLGLRRHHIGQVECHGGGFPNLGSTRGFAAPKTLGGAPGFAVPAKLMYNSNVTMVYGRYI